MKSDSMSDSIELIESNNGSERCRNWLIGCCLILTVICMSLSLPTVDSNLYKTVKFSNGAHIQLRAVNENKYVRVDKVTRHLLLTESRPWLHGSTFRVVKRQEEDECFQLRSSYGTWVVLDTDTAELSADAKDQADATLLVAIDPSNEPYLASSLRLPNAPNSDISRRNLFESSQTPSNKRSAKSSSQMVSQLKLKVCARSQWLNIGLSAVQKLSSNESISPASTAPPPLTVKAGSTAPTPTNYQSIVRWWTGSSERSMKVFSQSDTKVHYPGPKSRASADLFIPAVFEASEVQQWRGVNLGGWFIPEVWMNPSFYNGTGLGWGGSLCAITNYSRPLAESRMRNVIENFMTEKDFEEIAGMALNSVRLPVGYWNVMSDPFRRYSPSDEKFSLYYIDWCFDMAEKYGLTVLLDLHGGPGSQNGQDHSGCGVDPKWTEPANVALTLRAVEIMAKRYSGRPSLLGFELLNEPSYRYSQQNHSVLLQYYTAAYSIIRSHSPDAMIVFNELYDEFYSWWQADLKEPEFYNVVMDLHLYDWQLPFTKEPSTQHVRDAVNWKGVIEKQSLNHPVVIGEWCMSTGTWRQAGQPFVNAAVKSFDRSAGWYIWNWKVQRGIGFDEWDVQLQHQKHGLDPLEVYSKYDFIDGVQS